MLQEDSDFSMTWPIVLNFSGDLNLAEFESSINLALKRHPLLTAKVSLGVTLQEYGWVFSENECCDVQVQSLNDKYQSPWDQPIDLTKQSGLRVAIRYSSSRSEVRFFFHHASTDGIGGFRFIEDVMVLYDQKMGGPAKLRTIDPSAILMRDVRPDSNNSLLWRLRRSFLVRPQRTAQFLFENVSPIASSRSLAVNEDQAKKHRKAMVENLEELPVHQFSSDETTALIRIAQSYDVSLYELLISSLMLAINSWNEANQYSENRSIRVLVPFSLRNRKHIRMSAANCVSMAFVSARPTNLDDAQSLSIQIGKQLRYIKEWEMEYNWNQVAERIASSKLLSSLSRKKVRRRVATTVLSSVGKVFKKVKLTRENGKLQCGGLILESLHGGPPIRKNVPITFGCHIYAGRLCLAVNYDQKSFDLSTARKLLSVFGKRLSQGLT